MKQGWNRRTCSCPDHGWNLQASHLLLSMMFPLLFWKKTGRLDGSDVSSCWYPFRFLESYILEALFNENCTVNQLPFFSFVVFFLLSLLFLLLLLFVLLLIIRLLIIITVSFFFLFFLLLWLLLLFLFVFFFFLLF